MTEHEFVLKVEAMARRLELKAPRVKVAPMRGRDALRVVISGWTIRISPRGLAELTANEIDFAIAYAFMVRLRNVGVRPVMSVIPFCALTFIGFVILHFGQKRFVDNFWLGYGILLGLMVIGYLVGVYMSLRAAEDGRADLISQALLLTGNASAAETFLIRSRTDHVLANARRLASADRERLADQLDALDQAARRLGLSYTSVGNFD